MLISVLNILSIVSNRLGILILYKSVYQFQPVNQKITVIPSIWDLNRINIIRITNQLKNWSSYKITQYITNNHTNWTKRMNKWMKSLFFFASQYSCGTAFLSFYSAKTWLTLPSFSSAFSSRVSNGVESQITSVLWNTQFTKIKQYHNRRH